MSHEQVFELENSLFDEAKALATCLEYLERCASEAGLYQCAKLINLAAEAASDAVDELSEPGAALVHGQETSSPSTSHPMRLDIGNPKKSERAN